MPSLSSCSSCRRKLLASFGLLPPKPSPRRCFSRPTTAPKPLLDIKHIRQNPGLYEQNCVDRNYSRLSGHPRQITALFAQQQQSQAAAQALRARNNALRRVIAHAAGFSGDAEGALSPSVEQRAALAEAKALKKQLEVHNALEDRLARDMFELALALPNLSSAATPVGATPDIVGSINGPPAASESASDRVWRSHVHIGAELGLLDFEGAAKAAGWGWYFLRDGGAQLEQALVQYALAAARARGFRLVSPPSMVYAHVAAACGFQPRDHAGETQIYAVERADKDSARPQMVLAGTAEIPMAGMMAGETLEDADLPLKLVGVSRCYRAEAGARGVDTKGLYRVHEFTKVEMFAWTMPDRVNEEEGMFEQASKEPSQAEAVFDEMLEIQREILQSLGLHCRILEMPTADLGASASRKRDIEAFFPSRRETRDKGWGEVTSLSLCTDYQTRRLSTRVKVESGTPKRLDFPWTVNGTALAVPRIIAAILENGWDEESMSVTIPECLRPWMDGKDKIQADKMKQVAEISQ